MRWQGGYWRTFDATMGVLLPKLERQYNARAAQSASPAAAQSAMQPPGVSTRQGGAEVRVKIPPCCLMSSRSDGVRPKLNRAHGHHQVCTILVTASATLKLTAQMNPLHDYVGACAHSRMHTWFPTMKDHNATHDAQE